MKEWSSKEEEEGKENVTNEPRSRVQSFLDLLTIGVGSSLAVGISVLLGGLIKHVTGPAVVVSIVLAGFTALVGGLCYSEFGVRLVKSTSPYSYCYFWSKETTAFIFGWALVLEYVAGTASAAKGIITFIDALVEHKISDFLTDIVGTNFPNVFPYFDFLSMGIVAVVAILIVLKLKDCIIVKKVFTICNVVLIVSVITAGGFKADLNNWQLNSENSEDGFLPFGAVAVIKGTALAFYGFIGFDRVSITGHEIKKQKRSILAGILITIFVTLLAFAGVGVILTLILPYNKLNSNAVVPFAFEEVGWTAGKWVVAAATFFGFQTSLFGAVFPLPRIIHAMANDGLLFSFLSNNRQDSEIPAAATLVGGFIAAAAAAVFTFQELVSLSVIGALFVYTILALNVLVLRYSPKFDKEEMLSDSWKDLINKYADVTMKAVLENCFNFTEKHPTNLTEVIIKGNLLAFCFSSVGLGVIFIFFYDPLVACSPALVALAGIFLLVLFLDLISMSCQPKCQEWMPFKVPLVPLIPCLSVFLNIFLMLSFGSLTWILFLIWMAGGTLPHFAWRLIKCFRGEVAENSLFEINKTNEVKLNESIWKIKSDKKSFYGGADNPGFSDDLEERYNQVRTSEEDETKNRNEKTSLQLKEAEIIETAEAIAVERTEPLGSELELSYIHIKCEETTDDLPENVEKVHWECVAEVHTEEEYPQESIALEIVDNTYNFLSEVAEEMAKEEVGFKDSHLEETESQSEDTDNSENVETSLTTQSDSLLPSDDQSGSGASTFTEKATHEFLKEELLHQIELRKKRKNNPELKSEYSKSNENSEETVMQETSENPLVLLSEKPPDFDKEEQKVQNVPSESPVVAGTDTNASKPIPDEQNKAKEFKEKLNQLLKSHLNGDSVQTKIPLQAPETNETDKIDEKTNDGLFKSIKTLNKSQIKGKLELLLTTGPPKRAPLSSSFNIKIKDTQDDKVNIQSNNKTDKNDGEKPSENSIKEKILPLKTTQLSEDVCC